MTFYHVVVKMDIIGHNHDFFFVSIITFN